MLSAKFQVLAGTCLQSVNSQPRQVGGSQSDGKSYYGKIGQEF